MKRLTLFLLSLVMLMPSAFAASFPDQQEWQLNEDAISHLKDEGIVAGYPDGKFKVENRINRAELTKILIGAIYDSAEIEACQDTPFPDVAAGQWFTSYICMAEKNNIVDGYPDGTFGPEKFINFAEAAKIVAEAYDAIGSEDGTNQEWFAKYVKGMEDKKAIPSTVAFFDEPITRGEMAEMTYRLEVGDTSQNSLTYQEITDPLPPLSSCSMLEEKMVEYQNQRHYYYEEDMLMFDAAPQAANAESADEASSGSSKSSDDYSETNVQVEGVDEADMVKNDGKYIYLVKGDTVRIVNAYPGDQMEEVSNIDFNLDGLYTGFNPQELFVTDDRLVVIGNAQHHYYAKPLEADIQVDAILPPFYNRNQSKIFVYDISDRSAPEKLREVAFDGYYQTSRRIGEQVYLVLNAHPDYWAWDEVQTGENILPMLKDGEATPEAMVGCEDIHYFPGHDTPQFLITASVNIQDTQAAIDREVMLGSSDNVYMSHDNLYVTNTIYDQGTFTDWSWSRDESKSNIFKFALDQGDIEFEARGEVPGSILNQFSMDEHDGNFRIATTTGNMWSEENPSRNHVFIFDESMKQVGSVEDLAPGERIYSVRFLGDRGYVVTFKKVDPLFVLDLATPTNPSVLGKLKIPGYSDYLHPYDENHIIGFGKDAADPTAEEQEARNLDFAWYQGFKMAIFDVTDPSNPVQQHVESIGDRGTQSELLYNHKALLFDKEKGLLAFPISIMEKVDESDTDPLAPTETTFSGAVVYDIDLENGFTERGRITHLTEEDILKAGDYWDYNYQKSIQRILYIGEYLYTVAQGGIKSSDLESVEPVDFVQLEGEEELYPVDVMF